MTIGDPNKNMVLSNGAHWSYPISVRNHDAELHLLNRTISKVNELRHRTVEIDRKDMAAIEADLRIVKALLKGEAPDE